MSADSRSDDPWSRFVHDALERQNKDRKSRSDGPTPALSPSEEDTKPAIVPTKQPPSSAVWMDRAALRAARDEAAARYEQTVEAARTGWQCLKEGFQMRAKEHETRILNGNEDGGGIFQVRPGCGDGRVNVFAGPQRDADPMIVYRGHRFVLERPVHTFEIDNFDSFYVRVREIRVLGQCRVSVSLADMRIINDLDARFVADCKLPDLVTQCVAMTFGIDTQMQEVAVMIGYSTVPLW